MIMKPEKEKCFMKKGASAHPRRLNQLERYPGTGMGFESEVGRGSRFWIELGAAI